MVVLRPGRPLSLERPSSVPCLELRLLYNMLDVKLFAVACAAILLVWRVFKKRPQESSEEEELFRKKPHDIQLSLFANEEVLSAKLRASYTQTLVTIGRLPFNVLPIASPLISSEHAILKWNADEMCWKLKDVGSMNGTRLNDVLISSENRRPSDEHALRQGDVIVLAEDIRVEVRLMHPEVMARGRQGAAHASPLGVAPPTGKLRAKTTALTSRLLTTSVLEASPVRTQKPEQEEYYCPILDVEFAVLTQVGVTHLLNASPSEDVAFWHVPFGHFSRSGIFGICDGHSGADAATAIPRLFPSVLSNRMADPSTSLFSSSSCAPFLHATFLEVDSRLKTDAGSTATILLMERTDETEVYIQVANVGDSLGILINTNTGLSTSLTADHRVANAQEKQRLQELGNPLRQDSTRMYLLNLARALGDTHLKMMHPALIADPHVSPVIRITTNKSHLIVIASDGLWDCIGQAEVARLAVQAVQNWDGLRAFGNALIKLATQERGAKDDISIFLTRL